MAKTNRKICAVCNRPFVGRAHAKTCSDRCRKRLQRASAALAKEVQATEAKLAEEAQKIEVRIESAAKQAEELVKPLAATEEGYIAISAPQTLSSPKPNEESLETPLTPAAMVQAPAAVPAPARPLPADQYDSQELEAEPQLYQAYPPNWQPPVKSPVWQSLGFSSRFVIATLAVALIAVSTLALTNYLGSKSPSGSNGGTTAENILASADFKAHSLDINFDTTIANGRQLQATGAVVVQDQTDSQNAFRIQNANGGNVLVADTVNNEINIGDKPPGNVSLNVNGDITTNGSLVSTTNGYSLGSNGLTIGGVLVCTARGCVSSSSPAPTPASPTIDVANLAYLNASQTFVGQNKFDITSTTAFQIQNSSAMDNLFMVDTVNNRIGIGTTPNATGATLQIAGDLNVASGVYKIGNVPGANLTCGPNELLQQGVISGGILTSGSCVTVAGGTTPTLQQVYDASTPASLTLSSASGLFQIQDAASPLGTDLFEVTNNGASTKYFAINSLGISVTGNINTTGQYQVNGGQIASSNLADGANLAKLNGNQTFSGVNSFTSASNSFSGDGSNLTNLNAGNIASGTLNNARLSATVTTQGNVFNGNSQLVQLTAGGILPVLNGSNLTALNASNISSGTLSDSRLTSNVALLSANDIFLGNDSFHLNTTALSVEDASTPLGADLFTVTDNTGATKYFEVSATTAKVNGNDVCTSAGNCVGTGGGGAIGGSGTAGDIAVFTGSGFTIGNSNLSQSGTTTNAAGNISLASGAQYQINGTQISSANLSNDSNLAKLNANQTFSGNNTFSSASNSFTGNGSGLTSLNATNVSSGTLNDSRLSSNVALLNANQTFTGNDVFQLSTTGLAVQDAASPLGADLFTVTDNTGATKYFEVSATTAKVNGNDVCTSAGNCVGTGGGGSIGGGGTAGKLAKFTGTGYTIGDSLISDNGTSLTLGAATTVNGTLTVNTISPTATMTIGVASQTLVLQGDASTKLTATSSGITNNLVFALPTVSNKTITLPNASGTVAVSASGPLSLDAAGNLTCPSCLTTNGTGGGSGVSSVNTLNGDITLAGTTDEIIITPSSNTLTFSTPQAINTTSSPTFANINIGSGGQYELNGTQISSAVLSNDSNLAKLNANQTFTGNDTFNNTLTAPGLTAGGAALGIGAAGDTLNLSGTYSSNLAVTDGTHTTTIGFSGTSVGNVTYNFDAAAAAGAYTICTTANLTGACASGGVTTSSSGTNGTIAMFTGAQTIANSILTQASTTVSAAGNLNVTGQYQVSGVQIASSNLSDGADLAKLNATQTFTGDNTFQGTTVVQKTSTSAFQIQNASVADNLFIADTSNHRVAIDQATASYPLDVAGNINTTTGYRVGGTAGSGITCSSGNVIQNAVVTGGIITGGSCVANGAGATTTLQNAYDNSSSPATITTSSAAKGIVFKAGSGFDSTNLFNIQDSSGASTLDVDTAHRNVGINNLNPQATLDVLASSASFFDGFETGTLSPFTVAGAGWVASTSFPHTGSYSAYVTLNGVQSTLSLTKTLSSAGTISFYENVIQGAFGCTNTINFQIDGVTKNSWGCNTTYPYTLISYAISSGAHTFTWTVGSQANAGNYVAVDDVTVTNAGAGTAALFNGGNVGIGTSFPNATLDTYGTTHFQAASGSDSTSLFQVQTAAGTTLLNADSSNMKVTVGQSNLLVTDLSAPSSPGVAAGSNQGGTLSGAAATTYYYKITALSGAGESLGSSEVSINGASFTPLSVPGAPTDSIGAAGNVTGTYTYRVTFLTANGETTVGTTSAAVSPSAQQVNLTAIPTGPTGTTGRNVYRCDNTGANCLRMSAGTTLANNTTTSLTDNTASYSGNPADPASNTATTNTNNATVSWTAVTGATNYRVYRGTSSGSESAYQTTASSPFTDTGAAGTAGTVHTYSTIADIGIGTAAPSANLDVRGTVSFKNVQNSSSAFQVQDASSNILINENTNLAAVNDNLSTNTPTGTLLDSATWESGSDVLLNSAASTDGELDYTGSLDANFLDAKFQLNVGCCGLKSEETWFYAYNTSTPTSIGAATGGYAFVYNEWVPDIELRFNGTTLATNASPPQFYDNTWHSAEIKKYGNNIYMYLDGSVVLSYTDTARTLTGTKFGLASHSGGWPNSHRVRNFTVLTGYQQPYYGTSGSLLTVNSAAQFTDKVTLQSTVQVQNSALNVYQGSLNLPILSPPSATLSSSGSGGTLAAGTYFYKIATVGNSGTSSAAATIPNSVTTSGSTSQNTLAWTSVYNAASYNIYRSTDGSTWDVNNVSASTVSIIDNGSNYAWSTVATPPSSNTTGANLTANGSATFTNSANSTTSFQIQDANGANILSAGNSTGSSTLINDNMNVTSPTGTLLNSATYSAGNYVQLTSTGSNQNGEIEYTPNVPGNDYNAQFDFFSNGGGAPGEQLWFYSYDTSTPTTTGAAAGGYQVYFDDHNGVIGLVFNGSTLTSVSASNLSSASWHHVQIITTGTNFKVYYDGSLMINYTDIARNLTGNKWGFGASTSLRTDNHRVQNFSLVYTGTNALTVNANSTFQALANTTNAFQIQNAAGVQAVNISTVLSPNLVSNGDFESSTSGWSGKGAATIARNDTSAIGAASGVGSLAITTTAAANDGASFNYTFAASTQYTLSLYARSSAGTVSTINIGHQDVSGTDIDCLTGQSITTTWTRFTCTFTTGGTITPPTQIYIKQSDATARTFYIDGVQLEQAASASAFQASQANFQVQTATNAITLDGSDSGALGPWTTNANSLPAGRDSGASITANGYVYVIGGNNNTAVYYAKLNADGSTGTWQTESNSLPAGVTQNAAVSANGYVYIVGGSTSSIYYAKLNADGTTGNWITIANALPQSVFSPVSVVANGYIYAAGGSNGSCTLSACSSVYYAKLNADGSTGAWQTESNSLPVGRYLGSGAVVNGYFYFVGGRDTGTSGYANVYYAKLNSDGTTGSWSTAAQTLPSGRSDATTIVTNGYIYELGGFNASGQSTIYYAKLNSDGSTGAWQTATNSLPAARIAAMSVIANGYMYEIGGQSTLSTVFYASTSRIQIGANLDLVGLQGGTLSGPGDISLGSVGGSLTAGNGLFVGSLQVQGSGNFANGLSIIGNTTIQSGNSNSTAVFAIQNASGAGLLTADSTNMRLGVDVTYSAMSAPASLAAAIAANGSLAASSTYKYEVTAIDSAGGETAVSNEVTCTTGTTTCSTGTLGTNRTINLTWNAVTGASGYKVYRTAAGGATGTETYVTTVLTNSFSDSGSITPGSATPPASGSAYYNSANNSNSELQLSVGGLGTPTGQVYVSGVQPLLVGQTTDSNLNNPNGLAVQGKYAYVTAFTGNKLAIYDISNPSDPVFMGSSTTSLSGPNGLAVQGKYAYIANQTSGKIEVFDVSNPNSPTRVGENADSASAGIAVLYVSGRYLYTVSSANRVLAYDLSNPALPVLVGQNTTDSFVPASGSAGYGKYYYAQSNTHTALDVYDLSNPVQPVGVGSIGGVSGISIRGVKAVGRYVYAVSGSSNILYIFDVSNPTSPTIAGQVSTGSTSPNGLAIQGRYAYITGASKLLVYDISNPANPFLVAQNSDSAINQAKVIEVAGRYAYIVNASGNNLLVYDLGGEYSQQLEAGGIETGALSVDGNGKVGGSFMVQGGLSLGSTLQAAGNISISGGGFVQGSTVLGGGNNSLGAPTISSVVCSSGSGTTYGYKVSAFNSTGGETAASAEVTVSCAASLDGSHTATVSWSSVSGASGYNVYRTTSAGSPSSTGLIGSTGSATTSFVDGGLAGAGNSAPSTDTTGQLTVEGSSLFKNSTNSTAAFQIQNASGSSLLTADTTNNRLTLAANVLANSAATGTSTYSTTATAQTNVTSITVNSATGFAVNDVIFIDNAGQDYFTRITNIASNVFTVDPAVSVDANSGSTPAVTKYTVQYIGSDGTNFSGSTRNQNSFFQGYFLGGVVTGAGSTVYSDGNIKSINAFQITAPSISYSTTAGNSSNAFQLQNAIGSTAFSVDTTALNTLLTNSNFENSNVSTWTYSGAAGGSVARSTSQAYLGTASLSVTTGTTAAADDGVTSTLSSTLSASTTYTISWYDKITSGSFTDVIARYSYDGTVGNASDCTSINTQAVSTSGWTRHYCQFTTGSGGTAPTSANAIFIAQQGNNGGVQRTFYIDAVQVQSGSAPTAYKETGLSLNGLIATPVTIQGVSNSTTAFAVQDSSGNNLLAVDSVNDTITIGAPSANPTLLVLGIKNTSGDPAACTNGAMYYNSSSNQFRFCQGGSWTGLGSSYSAPSYVTSLPGSPTNGQEVYYNVDPTNGITWHLRYNSTSGYWEFLGGSPMFVSGATATLPNAGDYTINFGWTFTGGNNGYSSIGLSATNGTLSGHTSAGVGGSTSAGGTTGVSADVAGYAKITGASASDSISHTTPSGGNSASGFWYEVIPIRIQ